MAREFYMEGDVLMVKIPVDASNTVVRPATAEEIAAYNAPPIALEPEADE